MRSRSDRSVEQELARQLDDIEQALQERKVAAQRVGTYNIRHVVSENEGTHDWTGTLPPSPFSPDSGVKVMRLVVEAVNMDDLFCRAIGKIFVGSINNWYRPDQFLEDFDNLDPFFVMEIHSDMVSIGQNNQKFFVVRIHGDDVTQVWFKAYVIANDEVTITVQELN